MSSVASGMSSSSAIHERCVAPSICPLVVCSHTLLWSVERFHANASGSGLFCGVHFSHALSSSPSKSVGEEYVSVQLPWGGSATVVFAESEPDLSCCF